VPRSREIPVKKLIALIAVAVATLSGCVAYGVPYGSASVYYSDSPYYGSSRYYGNSGYYYGRRDRDRDGVSDRYDRDRDGDGVRNRRDAYPYDPRRY